MWWGERRRGLVLELRRSHRLTVAVLSVLLLLSLTSAGYLLLVTQPRLTRYLAIASSVHQAHDAMLDQRNALRGYLATGDPGFRDVYLEGRRTASAAFDALVDSAHADAEVTSATVATLLARQEWQSWANRAVRLPAGSGDRAVARLLRTDEQLFTTYETATRTTDATVEDKTRAAAGRQRSALFFVLTGYLLVLNVTAYVTVRRRRLVDETIVEPTGQLLATIGALRDGDLEARAARSGVVELDEIGAALDALAGDLEEASALAEAREARLAYLADRFETVARVAREIAGSLSVTYVAATTTTAAAELLRAPTTLWVRAEDQQFRAAHRSQDPHNVGAPVGLTASDVVAIAAADARVVTGTGRRAYPLVLAGMVVGVLEAATETASEEMDQVLQALLSTAAAALESAKLHNTARELAEMDGLTHLANRRRFDADLEAEWDRCRRYGRPLSLLMLDLDHFKRLNDEHGHLTGDQVLRQVAAAVRQTLRTSDTAYRYGGEEVAVLLRETPIDDAVEVAERLRNAIAALAVPGLPDLRVTASIGASERLPGMAHQNDLVGTADAALYVAKRNGRNLVSSGPPRTVWGSGRHVDPGEPTLHVVGGEGLSPLDPVGDVSAQ